MTRRAAVAAVLPALVVALWWWGSRPLAPIVIRWTTQSEENTFGYDVFRGPTRSGPYRRINAETILGVGTTDLPQRYAYSDNTIEPGKAYWYYVESVSLSGERVQLTPVAASRPRSRLPW